MVKIDYFTKYSADTDESKRLFDHENEYDVTRGNRRVDIHGLNCAKWLSTEKTV